MGDLVDSNAYLNCFFESTKDTNARIAAEKEERREEAVREEILDYPLVSF